VIILSKIPASRFVIIVYLTMILGVFGDHISTGIALGRANFFEANPFALNMMQKGIWTQVDAYLFIVSVATTFIILRAGKNPLTKNILIFPFAMGLLKLVVAF
jgi:hypothetical protein